ncbi:BPSS1780 family membrane protein [endosymbiont of Lamellibrachia barhami]|uniref:BPSS1780 family membrane protein n=1 Tax=endosymbiont of Lamellibrachia barhami TaxID=205975 RepID=UPI0015AC8D20
MSEVFKVVFFGQLQSGAEAEQVVVAFSERFKVDKETVRHLLKTDRDVDLKKNLTREQAEQYQAALEQTGLVVRIDPMADQLSLEPMDAGEAEEKEKQPEPPCPKCGADRVEDGTCLECGVVVAKYLAKQASAADAGTDETDPYAAPQADLVDHERGEITGPISVPAGHGWAWIVKGWWHFKQSPLAWVLALIIWLVMMILVNLVPLLGGILTNLFAPVIVGGFMLGAQAQDEGGKFELGHLFAGFSNNMGQLVLVGVIYMAGLLLLGVIVALFAGGMFATMGDSEMMQNPEAMVAMILSPTILLLFLLVMALAIPLMMAYWFAPALVVLDGMKAMDAMKLSIRGCLKNVLPFLVYGIVGMVLFILGVIPLGLGLLVVLPMMVASIYVSYRDIYFDKSR